MTAEVQRGLFALLCALGAIGILLGAWLELARARRGESLLAPWHLRLRLFSALLWVLILFSIAFAVTILWPPANATDNQKLQFLSVINGAVLLLLLAIVLLGGDMLMLARTRRRVEKTQALRFSQQLHELAEVETARARAEQERVARAEFRPIENDTEKAARNGRFDSPHD